MTRFGKYILVSIFLGWTLNIVQAAEKSALGKTQPAGRFRVTLSKGYLSLEANDASLAQIFEEIGKQAGIIIDSNIGPEEKITTRLDRVPLEQGIKQLAKNVTVFYTEDPKDKTRRISRVVALSEGKEVPSGQAKASPQPIKVKEPAPKSEPFKFEFDPGKFAEKQTPRKQP